MNYRISKVIRTAGIVGLIAGLCLVQVIRLQNKENDQKIEKMELFDFSVEEAENSETSVCYEIDKESSQVDSKKEKQEEMKSGNNIQIAVQEEEASEVLNENMNLIYVHVSGAVLNPDHVYSFPEGSRVEDAVNKAGGLLDEADLSGINLAGKLKDGMKIYIPLKGENAAIVSDDAAASEEQEDGKSNFESKMNGLTNINSASIMELDSLPGIGPALAQRIIDFRVENGSFQTIEDLKQVKGIGEKMFDKIKDRVTVG